VRLPNPVTYSNWFRQPIQYYSDNLKDSTPHLIQILQHSKRLCSKSVQNAVQYQLQQFCSSFLLKILAPVPCSSFWLQALALTWCPHLPPAPHCSPQIRHFCSSFLLQFLAPAICSRLLLQLGAHTLLQLPTLANKSSSFVQASCLGSLL